MIAPLGKCSDQESVEWRFSALPEPYEDALAAMETRVEAVLAGQAPELVWLLEHPPVYTAGTSASDNDLVKPNKFPLVRTGRGGKITYHGPGQRVVYVVRDLRKHGKDIQAHVAWLEDWVIRVLADCGIKGERRLGRIGIWVVRQDGLEEKIAALGVRVRRWIAYHGLSLNVRPDLEHYSGIVPCGIKEFGVTSLAALGVKASMADVDNAFRRCWLAD